MVAGSSKSKVHRGNWAEFAVACETMKMKVKNFTKTSRKPKKCHLLLSQAAAFGADLLVMGAYSHSRLHEWMFGGVTRTVLYEAGLPVLMSR